MPGDPLVMISPGYEASKLDNATTDDLIDVFEDRLSHWLIERAYAEIGTKNGEVAALSLLLSYFEATWSFISGGDSTGRSRVFFCRGFVVVFLSSKIDREVLARIAALLYKDARCGLFHNGMFREGIYLGKLPNGAPLSATWSNAKGASANQIKIESLLIDLGEFCRYVEGHFKKYLEILRDPSQTAARDAFTRGARINWKLGQPPPVVILPPDFR